MGEISIDVWESFIDSHIQILLVLSSKILFIQAWMSRQHEFETKERTSFEIHIVSHDQWHPFQKSYGWVLLIFLEVDDAQKVVINFLDGFTSGHYRGETTAHNFFQVGYYCPILFKYGHAYAWKRKACQVKSRREKRTSIPLQPIIINQSLQQWGLHIIGDITPNSSNQH